MFFLIVIVLILLFEAINGCHDTAHAVATVIYTKTLKPSFAVILSSCMNFLGVMTSNMLVAWSIVKLFPVEILSSESLTFLGVGIIATTALFWNFLTWYRAIPASSSHTLIGSIIGVGMAYHWTHSEALVSSEFLKKGIEIFLALLFSPIFGFSLGYILHKLFSNFFHSKLFQMNHDGRPESKFVRSLLITTSSFVSFSHGTNDGQKGLGLLLLLLLSQNAISHGAVPPNWSILLIAVALSVGTAFGWERVTTTIGEKIGTSPLTPSHGAISELIAASTILGASFFGFPVSTTHILSSSIAGTMVGGGHGVNFYWIKKILLTWVITLPVTILISFLVGIVAF
jgi:inorganic phosphate transporter, PiT family